MTVISKAPFYLRGQGVVLPTSDLGGGGVLKRREKRHRLTKPATKSTPKQTLTQTEQQQQLVQTKTYKHTSFVIPLTGRYRIPNCLYIHSLVISLLPLPTTGILLPGPGPTRLASPEDRIQKETGRVLLYTTWRSDSYAGFGQGQSLGSVTADGETSTRIVRVNKINRKCSMRERVLKLAPTSLFPCLKRPSTSELSVRYLYNMASCYPPPLVASSICASFSSAYIELNECMICQSFVLSWFCFFVKFRDNVDTTLPFSSSSNS
ncbi:hypothetical protein J3F83DRAFT_522096 [Trichoderma novae-zelandiae]